MIRSLDPLEPPAPGKPQRPGAAANQRMAAAIATDATTWSADQAKAMADQFDELAQAWDAERGGYRATPACDALARGGPWPAGLCVEVGAGTGLLTPHLARVWPNLVAVDISQFMIARSRHPWRVRADAAHLPLPDGVAAAVVIGDAPLFAAETARVLTPDGVILWSNALGVDAPFHVPTSTLIDALGTATHTDWEAVESSAGWGSWAVLRRV